MAEDDPNDDPPLLEDNDFEAATSEKSRSASGQDNVWLKIALGVVVAIALTTGVMFVKGIGPFASDDLPPPPVMNLPAPSAPPAKPAPLPEPASVPASLPVVAPAPSAPAAAVPAKSEKKAPASKKKPPAKKKKKK